MKPRRRGRPPLGRRAMTDAERQAKRRERLRKEAKHSDTYVRAVGEVRPPPHGYHKAKQQLREQGHHFERTRREWGFEFGIFVDGAFVSSDDVIMLADMSKPERQQWLDAKRIDGKHDAIHAVRCYMAMMGVSLDELQIVPPTVGSF